MDDATINSIEMLPTHIRPLVMITLSVENELHLGLIARNIILGILA
jgi:hypothetical protein